MKNPDLRAQILETMTEECREIYLRLESASKEGEDLFLSAEDSARLTRLVFHVVSMNLRLEEWASVD